ncbi:hypothetical protein ACTI_74730 [Actinoplanes sp. OR16]|uniref:SpoIIE family protein phosphatase n=1 Tax=Actinoplanes sp. OR16 TaxID=946334 RepID=UPI000F71507E|nr:SpoIIE family protein phosphatase [Actinoplanes sp. OR16]BBH70788.1 hypothetical protein ACTI_74730 [Actinoplanes sp. OR16]
MPASVSRPMPLWQVLGVVVVLYAAGASLAFLGFGAASLVVLFLPAGVTLSALVLNPRRRWPWILLAVAITEVAVDVGHGMAPRWAWGFALANTMEPLVGALLLRRYVPGDVDLLRPRHLTAFLTCCVGAGPAAGALIGATMLAVSTGLPWPRSAVSFWAGDATGVLVVAGCVLAWRTSRRPVGARWPVWVVLAVAATVAGFWPQHVPLFYLPVPVLFALAFTQPLPVTMTAALATTVTANLMTSTGHGPWAAADTTEQWRTLTLQTFLATTILGALLLTVGVEERDLARRDTSRERAARLRLNALQVLTTGLAKAATSEAIAQAIVRDGIGLVADQGSVTIIDPAITLHTDDSAMPGIASDVRVPIHDDDGRALGSLTFGFHRANAVDEDVLSFAAALATLTGQALHRAQSYEREISAAHQLQQALLPVVVTDGLPGVQVSADYRPADLSHQVGGDWYDVFALPGGRIGFAVGDVVGHHVTAAAAMARLQSALRFAAQTALGPARVLEELDRASTTIADSMMTTVGFADYDPATRLLRFACAGHPPPLLITGNDAEFLWAGRSMPLGVGEDGREHGERVVEDRAAVVWYTDGLVERHDQHIAASMRRLADAAGRHGSGDAHTLRSHLMRQMVGDRVLGDDTAILCVRFTPADG